MMVKQYSRHIFIAKGLPTCANFTHQKTLKVKRQFPDAAEAILDKFFVDDYLDCLKKPHKTIAGA